METPIIKRLIERDISEKESIKQTIKRITRLQIFVVVLGIFLFCAFMANVYITILTLGEIKVNRQTTIDNRKYGDRILEKLDSVYYKK